MAIKKVRLRNSTPFIDNINEINNTQEDNAIDIAAMSMCNLIEYSDNYLKTPGSLCQHYRDEPALDNNGRINDFPDHDK